MPNKKIIVVLGMHRSGTSVITRGLQVMGVELGERMMPPVIGNNPKGFWEDVDVNALNIEMLESIGSDWCSVSAITLEEVEALRNHDYHRRAAALLQQKINDIPVFGLKDPRIAKLLPFWKEVFSHCGLEVRYILAVRNPLSVAKSLAERDGIEAEQSYLLWLGHVIISLLHSSDDERVVVDYDRLIQSPDRELNRISNCTSLEIDPAELESYKRGFLDEELRHTVYTLNDLSLDAVCPPIVREVYTALLDAASDNIRLEDVDLQKKIMRWSDEYERLKLPLLLADRLLSKITELDEQIGSLSQSVTERDGQIAVLKQAVIDTKNELEKILASKSWLITKPLRFARRKVVSSPYVAARRALSDNSRALWRALPISYERKRKLKGSLFKTLPWAFRWTKAYQAWETFGASANYDLSIITQKCLLDDIEHEYVPLLKASPLEQKPAKLICFYLPQFHAVPENNEWWGEGFTEWTNVQPAQPQFVGHYQPHVPGELGYYNLLDPAIQHRQVELAKLYGIEGFCFYFYWFGGRRLLVAPIENYLNDKSLDLPFCLCWANENWSRCWDGLDSEILITQKHSVEDDLAFIKYVASYMQDDRYIRINGRPLLLVYRPSLLPSAKETASLWRDWCRVNGLGEIYLAYTQSFEAVDPAKYGFDAAIEFPPNNSTPPNITDGVIPLSDNFGSAVYDWRIFVERSEYYKQPSYTLFRSVCPSWDNTARRKNRGTVFLGSSPNLYQRWLVNAIRDYQANRSNSEEHLIFVNAWNEWAEGAHLEPDARYGYAYLEATRMALVRSTMSNIVRVDGNKNQSLAIVVHVFYPDVFEEILQYLDGITIPFKLFVTTTSGQRDLIEGMIVTHGFEYCLMETVNRGRDVLPFLKIVPRVIEEGFEVLLKIHTKKSKHRQDGDAWRNDVLEKLLAPTNAKRAMTTLLSNENTGMVAPAGHVVSMSTYWGSNRAKVLALAARMGVEEKQVLSVPFAAGTMFFVRISALRPLLNLAVSDDDFEEETGQLDGTLAHAIERMFSVSLMAMNQILVTTDQHKGNVDVVGTSIYSHAQIPSIK